MNRRVYVYAKLRGRVAFTSPLHLDAILASAIARRENLPFLPRGSREDHIARIDIPFLAYSNGVARATVGAPVGESWNEVGWINTPCGAQRWGKHLNKCRTVSTSCGPYKHGRIRRDYQVMRGMLWAAAITDGSANEIALLLSTVDTLGNLRRNNAGNIESWHIFVGDEAPDPWPIIGSGGVLLRSVPAGFPGAIGEETFGAYEVPYWHWSKQCDILSPSAISPGQIMEV